MGSEEEEQDDEYAHLYAFVRVWGSAFVAKRKREAEQMTQRRNKGKAGEAREEKRDNGEKFEGKTSRPSQSTKPETNTGDQESDESAKA